MALDVRPRAQRNTQVTRCLGVDPGLASCGFAVVAEGLDGNMRVVHTEVVLTEKSSETGRVADDDLRRLLYIQRAVVRLLHEHNPNILGVETYTPLAGKGANGSFKVCQVYGLVVGLAASANRPVYGATPQDIRRAFIGGPKGSKNDVQMALTRVCSGVTAAVESFPKSHQEHVADAIAHAVLALDNTRTTRRIVRARKVP